MQLLGVPLRGGVARGRAHLLPIAPAPGDALILPASQGSLLPEPHILCASRLVESTQRPVETNWAGLVIEQASAAELVVPGPPVVGGLDPDLFREGDLIEMDGGAGTVRLEEVREVRVVTSFLERPDGCVLLLRRSDQVGSFQGRWAGVSGFLEDPTPLEQAVREIREETGVGQSQLDLAASGRPVYARDGDRIYVVAPFRFRTLTTEIRLDWEHSEYAWVRPADISRFPTVPRLDRVWEAVAPRSARGDRPNP